MRGAAARLPRCIQGFIASLVITHQLAGVRVVMLLGLRRSRANFGRKTAHVYACLVYRRGEAMMRAK